MASARLFRIKGLCTAPVTPFKENGDLNTALIKPYVQHINDFGVANVFINGTNGEGNAMTLDERKEMAKVWVHEASDILSGVIVHIGAANLRESQELARHAESVGANAIACVGPTYYKPTRIVDYVEYMRQVAQAASNTPFIFYDIGFVTGISLSSAQFFREAAEKIPTLCGIKHTTPDYPSMNTIHCEHKGEFQVVSGLDEGYLEALSIGLDAIIHSSYMGHVMGRIKKSCNSGNMEAARLDQYRAIQANSVRRKYDFSIPGGTKAMLRAITGIQVGSPRLPLPPITDQEVANVRKDLEQLGFFQWGSNA